jgi:hypothetical protein
MTDVMESSYSVLPLAAETARKTDRLGRWTLTHEGERPMSKLTGGWMGKFCKRIRYPYVIGSLSYCMKMSFSGEVMLYIRSCDEN